MKNSRLHRKLFLTAWRLALAGVLLAACAAAWAQPLVLVDIPARGPLGQTASMVVERLVEEGYDVWWVGQREPNEPNRFISAVVSTTSAATRREQGDDLPDYVKRGGGFVYLPGTAASQVRLQRQILAAFGMEMHLVSDQDRRIFIEMHEVTNRVSRFDVDPLGIGMSGTGTQPLIKQGGHTVALAGELGQGRMVVIPHTLITPATGQNAPSPSQVRLLTEAVKWAAVTSQEIAGGMQDNIPPRKAEKTYEGDTAGQPGQPGRTAEKAYGNEKENLKQGSPALSGAMGPNGRVPFRYSDRPDPGPGVPEGVALRAIVDMTGTDERWPEIAEVVDGRLQRLGVRMERPAAGREDEGLAAFLPGPPRLIVVGSYREFSDAEATLLADAVRRGSSLLALVHAGHHTQVRATHAGRLLAEMNIGVAYGRPGGATVGHDHPAARGMRASVSVPPGVSIWSRVAWPLVTVDQYALASAHRFGEGRVVVFDAGTLLPPGPRERREDTSAAFAQLLDSCLQWLVGK